MSRAGRTVGEIIARLEALAPASTAEDWDNVGLLAGDPAWSTDGAVICVDLTEKALDVAVKRGYRLVINHHPCIFPKGRGLGRLTPDGGMRSLILRAIREGIAVYCTHTNFDRCALEVQAEVAAALGAEAMGRLHEVSEESLLKLVAFVPRTHAEKVREAICEAGAGQIGNYDQCAFATAGEGTFRGNASSNPFLGKPGELERADEIRLETVLPRGLRSQVLKALFASHPYEEVAYDLYAVEQQPATRGLVKGLGYGFWGEFKKPRIFSAVHNDVIRAFQIQGYWHTEPAPKAIKRVAFVAGKGASFIDAAAAAGCDLFITGEAGYHAALAGARKGVTVMEIGHRESERFFPKVISAWIKASGLKAEIVDHPLQRIRSQS